MHSYYAMIAEDLFFISDSRIRSGNTGKLLCYMMAQVCEILHTSKREYDRESALMYFNSGDFTKHCRELALEEDTVQEIFLNTPVYLRS